MALLNLGQYGAQTKKRSTGSLVSDIFSAARGSDTAQQMFKGAKEQVGKDVAAYEEEQKRKAKEIGEKTELPEPIIFDENLFKTTGQGYTSEQQEKLKSGLSQTFKPGRVGEATEPTDKKQVKEFQDVESLSDKPQVEDVYKKSKMAQETGSELWKDIDASIFGTAKGAKDFAGEIGEKVKRAKEIVPEKQKEMQTKADTDEITKQTGEFQKYVKNMARGIVDKYKDPSQDVTAEDVAMIKQLADITGLQDFEGVNIWDIKERKVPLATPMEMPAFDPSKPIQNPLTGTWQTGIDPLLGIRFDYPTQDLWSM